jgi:beta-glucanase (GH16 family)
MSKHLRIALLSAIIAVGLLSQLVTSTRLLSLDQEFPPLAADIGLPHAGSTAAVVEERPPAHDPPQGKKPSQGKDAAPTKPETAFKGKLLLDEGFDGHSLDSSRWNTCHWWGQGGCTIASNDELEWYSPEQVKVSDGALHLTALKRTVYGSDGRRFDYASGMVTTGPRTHDSAAKLAFTYGTVEVRFKLPEGQGLWPAIWLLPASTESLPEIDMLEVLGDTPDTLRMHMHPKDRSGQSQGSKYTVPGGYSLAGGWHTLGLDWKPNRLVYWLDGKKVWDLTDNEVPDEPMYLVMNLAVGGNYPGSPDSTTPFPATFLIDRIRIRENG